jgi:hypothetical protein
MLHLKWYTNANNLKNWCASKPIPYSYFLIFSVCVETVYTRKLYLFSRVPEEIKDLVKFVDKRKIRPEQLVSAVKTTKNAKESPMRALPWLDHSLALYCVTAPVSLRAWCDANKLVSSRLSLKLPCWFWLESRSVYQPNNIPLTMKMKLIRIN